MILSKFDLLEVDCIDYIELYLVLDVMKNYVRYLSITLDKDLEIDHFNIEETTMVEVYEPELVCTLDEKIFLNCYRERDIAERIRHIYLNRGK